MAFLYDRRFFSGSFALPLFLFAFLETMSAQSPPVSEIASASALNLPVTDIVIKKRVDEVNLLFTVVDKRGRFINKLQVADFQLLDDQQPPERIRTFHQESDLPLRIALLIDISGSVRGRFQYERVAASQFLKNIVRPATDKAFIVGFDNNVQLVQDFTNDVAAMSAAVHGLKPDAETALFDALVFAAEKLRTNSEPGTRRVIVLISDGDNNSGNRYMHEAQEAALRAEAPIYALSTNVFSSGEYSRGEAILELLTRYTGGDLLAASSEKNLTRAFRQIEQALRSQYVISYKPAGFEPNGKYRTIKLTVRDPNLAVECRRGYFAPTD